MSRLVLALTLTGAMLIPGTPARSAAGYDSSYAFESAFLTLPQGGNGTFAVFFVNTGALSWTRGAASEVALAACLPDQVTCGVVSPNLAFAPDPPESWPSARIYAVAGRTSVAPGEQVAFSYRVRVPITLAPGTYRFHGELILLATGERIHPEGYYQDVKVVAAAQAPVPPPTPAPPGTRPATDVQAFAGAYDGGATNNDVRVIFSAPVSNGQASYEVQRAAAACPLDPAATAFGTVATVTATGGGTGAFDLDRAAGTYCYQVRVRDTASAMWLYSNQAVVTVFGGSDASVPTSVSATLTASQGDAMAVDTGDVIRIVFSKAMQIAAGASLGLTDADCGAPPSQSGPATCPSGQTQTRATIQCGLNATCVVSLDAKTLEITVSSAPALTNEGSVPGVQMPAMITSATGFTDANGAPWQLTQSADRTFGAGIGQ